MDRVLIPPQDLAKCRICGGSRGFWLYSNNGDNYYAYERRYPELSNPNNWSDPLWGHCRTCNPDNKFQPRKRKCKGKLASGRQCSRKGWRLYCRQHQRQAKVRR